MAEGYKFDARRGSGLYIEISVTGYELSEVKALGNEHKFIIPLQEDTFTTPTDRQQFFQPIQELFDKVSDVIGGLGANYISGIADLVVKYQDIFGTRLFNSDMFAQAWKHAKPSELSLKLDFKFGTLDEWSGKKEVLQPLLVLKRNTLPMKSAGGTYHAPGPTALGVYTAFGKNIFDATLGQALNMIKKTAESSMAYSASGGGEIDSSRTRAGSTSASVALDKSKSSVTSLLDATVSAAKTAAGSTSSYGLWKVKLLAYNGKDSKELFVSPDMVCSESTISFGNQLDEEMCPISGSCTLALTSQAPTPSHSYILNYAWDK